MMLAGVSPHRQPGRSPLRPRQQERRPAQRGPGQPRRHEIQQIVQPRRRPAEMFITRRTMADHAVGRVDDLVGEDTGQAEQQRPEQRRRHGIGEVLGQRFECRPRHTPFVERLRIAPDDVLDGIAPADQAGLVQAARDRGDMAIETVLGDQRAHEHGMDHPAERDQAQQGHDHPPDCECAADQEHHGDDAPESLPGRAIREVVERLVEPIDEAAGEHGRVRNGAVEPFRVADRGVDQESQKQYRGIGHTGRRWANVRPQIGRQLLAPSTCPAIRESIRDDQDRRDGMRSRQPR